MINTPIRVVTDVMSCVRLWLRLICSVSTSFVTLEKNGELTRIQEAFIEEGAVQCGFCTPGFIMSATVLLEQGKELTREEIRKKMSGNLCRCTGYQNIVNAVEKVMHENAEKGI